MNKLRSHKWVLITAWVVLGIILLHLLAIVCGIINTIRMSSNTKVTETVSYSTFFKNKGDFEAMADLATELFNEEFENNHKLVEVSLHQDGTCFYHYNAPSLNKSKVLDYSDRIKEAFDVLTEIYRHDGNAEGGLPVVTANEIQVVFSGRDHQSSVVYNNSISKPKTLRGSENEVFAMRLGFKWFQCGEKAE